MAKTSSVGTLVVQSKVKDYARAKGVRVSGDFIDALSDQVEGLVDDAIERAKDNGRSTIRASDL
jgi:histone H3/H4